VEIGSYKPTINTYPAGDPAFGLPKAHLAPCLTLCNRRQKSDSDTPFSATCAILHGTNTPGSRQLLCEDFRASSFRPCGKFKRAVLIFSNLKSQGERPTCETVGSSRLYS